MDGIVEGLLRLEGAKHKALIEGCAPVYDDSVRAQLLLLDSSGCLESAARTSPEQFAELAKLIRLNTSLFLNLIHTSAVFAQNFSSYSSAGRIEPRIRTRIAVEG